MRKFLTSIAIAALATATAQADPGGNGKGGGKDQAARGGGQMSAQPGKGGGNDKGNGGMKAARANTVERTVNRGPQGDNRVAKGRPDVPAPAMRDDNRGNGAAKIKDRGNDVRVVNYDRDDRRNTMKGRVTELPRIDWRGYDSRSIVQGCPPGLAKKNNGCTPPGLARNNNDWDRYDADWWGLRGLTAINGYRYYDGNLVRYSPSGGISDYYPLLGGALGIGNIWPSGWSATPVSPYYENYYGLGDDYRYFDGAIYRLDPETQAIQTVAALLTGDTFNIGQRVPDGYGVYNVPYDYRSQYADGPDAYYRYSDGYVYEVDPTTQLITAAINLLT